MNEEANEYVADESYDFDDMEFGDFLSGLKEEFAETTEPTETTETVETVDQVEVPYEDSTEETVEEAEITPPNEHEESVDDNIQFQSQRQNEAFKSMRESLQMAQRQAQEMSEYKTFLDEMASQSGLTTQQLIEQTRSVMLEKQAQEQHVPVEVMKRMQEQERQLQAITHQQRANEFNGRVGALAQKLNLNESNIQEFFSDCKQQGIDLLSIPNLEMVYKGLYADRLVEQKIQEQMAMKRKRVEQAQINPVNTAPVQTQGFTDKDIDSALARFGFNMDEF